MSAAVRAADVVRGADSGGPPTASAPPAISLLEPRAFEYAGNLELRR